MEGKVAYARGTTTALRGKFETLGENEAGVSASRATTRRHLQEAEKITLHQANKRFKITETGLKTTH